MKRYFIDADKLSQGKDSKGNDLMARDIAYLKKCVAACGPKGLPVLWNRHILRMEDAPGPGAELVLENGPAPVAIEDVISSAEVEE